MKENTRFLGTYVTLVVSTVLVLTAMILVLNIGNRMSARCGNLDDAAMQVEIEIDRAHLRLEEVLSGDRRKDINAVWLSIDNARWYMHAMLEGGSNKRGKYLPVVDPKMRAEVEHALQDLDAFRRIAQERWDKKEVSGIASEADQKFDSICAEICDHILKVEYHLHELVRSAQETFRSLQIGLMAFVVLLSIITGLVFRRNFIALQRSEQEVHAANQDLYVSNQQLKATEGTLLEYQDRLRSLGSELLLVEERERKRIATLLHDDVCQILGLILMKLRSLASNPQPEVVESVSESCDLLKQAIETTRTLLSDLRPALLYDLGLEAAVGALVENMVKWQEDIKPVFEDDGQSKPFEDGVRTLIYQSVGELLMNIIKHAKASKVKVSMRKKGNSVSIVVEDDGVGFDVSAVLRKAGGPSHFGLFSIRERMRSLGGKFEIESDANKGTQATLLAPLSEQ